MKRKTWIKVKRGILEPKHRVELGIRVWLYLHILDRADWETGKILEWIDESEAQILNMSVNTLRKQRRQLEKAGYITAQQKKHSQEIIIHNWTDPRKYDGKEINKGDQKQTPYEKSKGDHSEGLPLGLPQGLPQGYTANGHSSLDSHITDHKSQKKDSRSNNERNEMIEAVLEVCNLSWDTFRQNGKMRGLINRTAKIILQRELTPDNIRQFYGKGGWWWTDHWIGKDKNSVPRPEQIADTLDQAIDSDQNSEVHRKEYAEGWQQE